MYPFLDWGIPIIAWFQNLGDWLQGPMSFFSLLGTENFYLAVMPALLWSVNVRWGIRAGLILLTSEALNISLKHLFGLPRPYWVSEKVRALSSETSFGLPSGHAQNGVTLWGSLAASIRRSWATAFATALIFLISLSRLYLGVHYPTDVIGGWIVGGLLLWAFLALEEPLVERLRRRRVTWQILAASLATLLLLALCVGVLTLSAGRSVPQVWQEQATRATGLPVPIQPWNLNDLIASTGTLFGFAVGGVLLLSWGRFDAGGAPWKRIARYVVGLAGVIVVYFGLKAVFIEGDTLMASLLRFVRYAATGFWVSYLAPRVFVWLKLA